MGSSNSITLGQLNNSSAHDSLRFCPPLSPVKVIPPTLLSATFSNPTSEMTFSTRSSFSTIHAINLLIRPIRDSFRRSLLRALIITFIRQTLVHAKHSRKRQGFSYRQILQKGIELNDITLSLHSHLVVCILIRLAIYDAESRESASLGAA